VHEQRLSAARVHGGVKRAQIVQSRRFPDHRDGDVVHPQRAHASGLILDRAGRIGPRQVDHRAVALRGKQRELFGGGHAGRGQVGTEQAVIDDPGHVGMLRGPGLERRGFLGASHGGVSDGFVRQ